MYLYLHTDYFNFRKEVEKKKEKKKEVKIELGI